MDEYSTVCFLLRWFTFDTFFLIQFVMLFRMKTSVLISMVAFKQFSVWSKFFKHQLESSKYAK